MDENVWMIHIRISWFFTYYDISVKSTYTSLFFLHKWMALNTIMIFFSRFYYFSHLQFNIIMYTITAWQQKIEMTKCAFTCQVLFPYIMMSGSKQNLFYSHHRMFNTDYTMGILSISNWKAWWTTFLLLPL